MKSREEFEGKKVKDLKHNVNTQFTLFVLLCDMKNNDKGLELFRFRIFHFLFLNCS